MRKVKDAKDIFMRRTVLICFLFFSLVGCKARAEQSALSGDLESTIKDPFSDGVFPDCHGDVRTDVGGPYTVILDGKTMSKSDYIELLLNIPASPAGFKIEESSRLVARRPIDQDSVIRLVLTWDSKRLSDARRNEIAAKGGDGAREYRHSFLNRIQKFSHNNQILCGWK